MAALCLPPSWSTPFSRPPRANRLADSGDRLLAVDASVAWAHRDQIIVFGEKPTLTRHAGMKTTSIELRVRKDLQDRVPVVRPKRKLIPKPGAQNSRSAENKASVSRSDKEPAFAWLKLVVTRVFTLPYLEHRRRDAAKCDFDPKLRVDRLACPAPEDDFAGW